jgi:pyrroline-5-carboxylate reductase
VIPLLILFGAGQMGSALLKGWIKKKILSPENLIVIEPEEKKHLLIENLGGGKIKVFSHLKEIPPPPKNPWIVWAIKPQTLREFLPKVSYNLKEISPSPETVEISIAAGVTFQELKKLRPESRIVRAMPNQLLLVNEGVTALYTEDTFSTEEKEDLEKLFASCGEIFWVEKEEEIHAFTSLSGSGPAFVAHLLEGTIEAGIAMGLSYEKAKRIACKLFSGTARLLEKENLTCEELQRRVTSPGGTTISGLLYLKKEGVSGKWAKAFFYAWERAKELSKG